MTDAEGNDEKVAAAERVLDREGVIFLDYRGWPGATQEAVENAYRAFLAVAERLGLEVERLPDSSRLAYRPGTAAEILEPYRRQTAANLN